MAGPGPRDISIYRGDDYPHAVTFTDAAGAPLDVSAYAFTAQIRSLSQGGTGEPLAEFTIDDSQAATGIVVLSLAATETADLAAGYWDLQADDGTTVSTWLAGRVSVSGDVTHE